MKNIARVAARKWTGGDMMCKFIIGLFMGGVVGFMTMAIITIGKGGE